MPLWKRGSPGTCGKHTCEIRMRLKASTRKARGAVGRDRGQLPGLNFTRIGDDSAHLANDGVEKAHALAHRGFFGGGDFVKDRRLQNLRRVIVIFGGVNHRARSAGGGFLAKSLRQDAMNTAGPRPGIETDAGHGGGDFFRLGHRIHQTRDILGRGGIFNLHRTDARRFHAIGVGDVDRVAPGVAAKGIDGVRRHLAHHQTGEAPGAKSFVEKEARLNGPETETHEGAMAGQCHEFNPP